MNKSFTTILAASLLLFAMPFAGADEAHPDCEPGQAGLTYDGFLAGPTEGVVCEGEHWDGQDPIRDDPAKTDQPCLSDVDAGHVSFCQSAAGGEANVGEGESDATALKPVTFRFSSNGAAHYLALNIDQVGQVIVYADGEIAAVYLEDGSPLNVLATAVSSAGITQGKVGEEDCDQATYAAGATAEQGDPAYRQCSRDNTAVTVVLP